MLRCRECTGLGVVGVRARCSSYEMLVLRGLEASSSVGPTMLFSLTRCFKDLRFGVVRMLALSPLPKAEGVRSPSSPSKFSLRLFFSASLSWPISHSAYVWPGNGGRSGAAASLSTAMKSASDWSFSSCIRAALTSSSPDTWMLFRLEFICCCSPFFSCTPWRPLLAARSSTASRTFNTSLISGVTPRINLSSSSIVWVVAHSGRVAVISALLRRDLGAAGLGICKSPSRLARASVRASSSLCFCCSRRTTFEARVATKSSAGLLFAEIPEFDHTSRGGGPFVCCSSFCSRSCSSCSRCCNSCSFSSQASSSALGKTTLLCLSAHIRLPMSWCKHKGLTFHFRLHSQDCVPWPQSVHKPSP
mmetsp:Transcript_18451/g.51767  ORF Transcript_18451/g.51767 Transcript_18451/m.51767 type:complete len:361 (+) Transcript_18451:3075-4157(+)